MKLRVVDVDAVRSQIDQVIADACTEEPVIVPDVSSHSAICPHCGFDLRSDRPTQVNTVVYHPRLGLFCDGKRLDLPPGQIAIAGALMRAQGRVLSRAVLADRSDLVEDAIDVHICRLRSVLKQSGAENAIITVYGAGYRWNSSGQLPATNKAQSS